MARTTATARSTPRGTSGKTSSAAPTPARRRGPRRAAQGDVVEGQDARALEKEVVSQAVQAARGAQVAALGDILERGHDAQETARQLRAILEGASPDDAAALRRELLEGAQALQRSRLVKPDEELAADWRNGAYPYKNLMSRKNYEAQKYLLQVELLKLQAWVKETGQRVVLLFEGRDAAGKGGAIKRFMEHLNPRGARVVALEKPSETERGQWYFQRYVEHLPTAGEIVMFDRSWYNRAGVERVMGFCNAYEYEEFMRQAPDFERHLVRSGIHLIKFWFSVSRD